MNGSALYVKRNVLRDMFLTLNLHVYFRRLVSSLTFWPLYNYAEVTKDNDERTFFVRQRLKRKGLHKRSLTSSYDLYISTSSSCYSRTIPLFVTECGIVDIWKQFTPPVGIKQWWYVRVHWYTYVGWRLGLWVVYNNNAHPVICQGWQFTLIYKTLAWSHQFTFDWSASIKPEKRAVKLWKESLNNDCQHFHQCQYINKYLSPPIIWHKKDYDIWF